MSIKRFVSSVITQIKLAKQEKRAESIGFLGNIVLLWERLAQEEVNLVHLGSDQTSLHNPFNGGYYPVQLSFEEANQMMVQDPEQFKKLVYQSLVRQVDAIIIQIQNQTIINQQQKVCIFGIMEIVFYQKVEELVLQSIFRFSSIYFQQYFIIYRINSIIQVQYNCYLVISKFIYINF